MIGLYLMGCGMLAADNTSTPRLELDVEDSAVVTSPVTFTASVDDPGDPLFDVTVLFVSDVDGELCRLAPGQSGLAVCTADLARGEHRITVHATDAFDERDTVERTIRVISPPTRTPRSEARPPAGDTGDTGA